VAGAAAAVGVLRTLPNFAKAATGDRILTVTGDHVAYVADARWVSPASVLFDEAMTQAFDAAAGPVRLVGRGEPAKADYVLRVDVRNFEATYDVGGRGAPTIVVRANAVLTRTRDHALVDARLFEARVRAGDNRVGAIVQAFGGASGQVLGQLVAWTAEKAPPLPAA
jgi:cholesterol transport system auxiliary component